MSDADARDCASVREMAPELALGLITGDERAAALAHLDSCAACRAHVDELAITTDALLLLAPEAEPPGGFETRVVERLGAAAPVAPVAAARRPWWRRRSMIPWAAAAACLVALALIVVVRDGGDDEQAAAVRVAAMTTSDGEQVGEVYIHDGEDGAPSWVHLSLPGWSGWESGDWAIRVTLDDGGEELMEMPPLSGRQTWGIDLPVDGDDVASVAMVNADGQVWCSAEL